MFRACRHLSGAIILAVVVIFAYAQQSAPQDPNAPRPKQDNWQRLTECADQVDRIIKREGLRQGQEVGSGVRILGFRNHYSPAYERCYLVVTYLNSDAEKNLLPSIYYELWDAFEENLLSMCTDLPPDTQVFCTIQDKEHPMDCNACRSFVKDRMTK